MAPDSTEAYQWLRSLSLQGSAPSWYGPFQNWWNAGHVVADLDKFAGGGIVSSPTWFMHSGRLAVAGEGMHREAIVPLPDGRSIPVDLRGGNDNSRLEGLVEVLIDRVQALEGQLAAYREEQGGRDDEMIQQGRDKLFTGTLAGDREPVTRQGRRR